MNAHTLGQLYESKTGNHQGLIIEEGTGKNVAVVYDKDHAAFIVRACNSHEAMLEALTQCVTYIQQAEDDGQANSMIRLSDSATLAAAKEALRLAEGKV